MTLVKKERRKKERREEKRKGICFPVQLVQRWRMQMIDDITAGLDNNSKQI